MRNDRAMVKAARLHPNSTYLRDAWLARIRRPQVNPDMVHRKGKTVLYTTMNDLSLFGGIETMIPQEVEYLRSHGFEVHILCRPLTGQIRVPVDEGVHVKHYPKRLFMLPWPVKDTLVAIWMCMYARRLSKNERILSVSFSAMDAAGPALAKLTGADVETIVRICGPLSYEAIHFTPKKNFRYKVYSQFFKLVEAFSYYMSDSIMPVSEFEEANAHSYGLGDDRVVMIRCGIPSKRFDGNRSARPLPLPKGKKVVMFVGRFYAKNGPLIIADAIPKILSEAPETVFVLVGDGPLKKELEVKMNDYIHRGVVIMTGFRSDIPQLHAQADVFVSHFSKLMDGVGQTVYEAMMSGLPVVVGRDPITETVIGAQNLGILVAKEDPDAVAEAVLKLLSDEGMRTSLGSAARRYALVNLSFEAMMNAVLRDFSEA